MDALQGRAAAPDRLHALDLCRGLCALGVAAYHLAQWGNADVTPAVRSVLALFGTYGVSVFFILSGYSLAHAYDAAFPGRIEREPLAAFFRRRIGRLAPLFLAVVLLPLDGKAYMAKATGWLPTLANATLVFGFADPTATPVIGGWSIGIEVVFYAVFPLLLVLRERAALIIAIAVLLTAWISADIARQATLAKGWAQYATPANHWIFFCAGVYARLKTPHGSLSPARAGLALVIASVVALSAGLDATELQIVVGWRRCVLVAVSIGIVALLAKLTIARRVLQQACSMMGGASYPLYLVHPVVFFTLRPYVEDGSVARWTALLSVAALLALAIDRYLDAPLQRRLKRLGW